MKNVIVTGACGLVGQNLVARLKGRGDISVTGIDKHVVNSRYFRELHPEVHLVEADLAGKGDWMDEFASADMVVINQAQIGGLSEAEFMANNVAATKNVLEAIEHFSVPYFIGISSSVVNSAADDFYTRSKAAQEALFEESGVPHCVLRPTLMFGWFDRKHLGWLRHFMDRTWIFPVPGSGQYQRQPLYVGDFVSVLTRCLEDSIEGTHDIAGTETLTYVEMIRTIRDTVRARARIVHIPMWLFRLLLWSYALFDRDPPFTTRQLDALVIPELFPGGDWPEKFDVTPTPFREAVRETFLHEKYGNVRLAF